MVDLINSRKSDGFELDHLFYILIYFYSFIGDKYTISPDLEMTLMSTLSKAITEDKDKYSGNVNLNFDTVSNIDEFCGIVFKKLNSLKTSRKHLFKYRYYFNNSFCFRSCICWAGCENTRISSFIDS